MVETKYNLDETQNSPEVLKKCLKTLYQDIAPECNSALVGNKFPVTHFPVNSRQWLNNILSSNLNTPPEFSSFLQQICHLMDHWRSVGLSTVFRKTAVTAHCSYCTVLLKLNIIIELLI